MERKFPLKKYIYPKIFVYFAKLLSFHFNSRKCYAIRLWKFLGIQTRLFHRMESTRSVVEKKSQVTSHFAVLSWHVLVEIYLIHLVRKGLVLDASKPEGTGENVCLNNSENHFR